MNEPGVSFYPRIRKRIIKIKPEKSIEHINTEPLRNIKTNNDNNNDEKTEKSTEDEKSSNIFSKAFKIINNLFK